MDEDGWVKNDRMDEDCGMDEGGWLKKKRRIINDEWIN